MSHGGIMVDDMRQAVVFYTKALGLVIVIGNTNRTQFCNDNNELTTIDTLLQMNFLRNFMAND